MIRRLKLLLRNTVVTICRWMGSEIRDAYTGEKLGRGLVCAWEGGVHVIGAKAALIPVPLPQERMTYWRQNIGFTTHPPVDFPRTSSAYSVLEKSRFRGASPQVLLVLLDHRSPEIIERAIRQWVPECTEAKRLLVAYGGPPSGFDAVSWPQKILIADPRLTTRDHQRDGQSYRAVFTAVSKWMEARDFTHVLFVEGDHVPLSGDILTRYLKFLHDEDADFAGYHLHRIDGSTHPHWLASGLDPGLPDPVLSMLGTGHFWIREAWDAVAANGEYAALYLELDMPTTANANGFRGRCLPNLGNAVMALPGQLTKTFSQAKAEGAWSMHPVK